MYQQQLVQPEGSKQGLKQLDRPIKKALCAKIELVYYNNILLE